MAKACIAAGYEYLSSATTAKALLSTAFRKNASGPTPHIDELNGKLAPFKIFKSIGAMTNRK